MKIENKKIIFALTEPRYAFNETINQIEKIVKLGGKVTPIMQNDINDACEYIDRIERITNNKIVFNIEFLEKTDIDIMVIAPCSGNTIAKLGASIYDNLILNCANIFLLKKCPLLIGIIAKDGLSSNAENIGKLLNRKNIFFIPFAQSNPITKPNLLSFYPKYIIDSIEHALEYEQIQPIIF